MSKPRLLDLFCCQGGASVGYEAAGFEVVGVDIDPQPRYPLDFHQADALKWALEHHDEFDAFHASPPCQAWTNAQRIQGNDHEDFIAATRSLFKLIGKPWVIENVPGSPLRDPIMLCGPMFGLETYRHRLFESNLPIFAPLHQPHTVRNTKMGRAPEPDTYMQIVGNFTNVDKAREVMAMPWANRDGLREAIPPAYSEWVGRQIIDHWTSVEWRAWRRSA